FVDSHSAVTRLDKIARWEEGVCPQVTGLPANFIKFITKRVRDLAAQVGAPVNPDENCRSNIEVIFTTKPQDLLNTIREKQPVMLGYFSSSSQGDELAKVNHDIQSWHATQTVDLRGTKLIDSRNPGQGNNTMAVGTTSSSGMRIGDGLHSNYLRGIIVANPDKLGDAEIGALADHIAMLALAQPASLGACQELPSILDLTNATCRKDAPVKALTKADTGYLQGLYKLDTGASLRVQKDAIASRVKEALAGK
ncbi:MAG: hypothetical protein ABI608_03115, partial [Rhizomicrobium sp.]